MQVADSETARTQTNDAADARIDDNSTVETKKAEAAEAAKASTAKKKLTTAEKAVKLAKKLRGTPYVAGGASPSGFDCSGFTSYVYGKIGVKLTHNAQAQFYETKSVSTSKMKAGDLVFFGSGAGSITHVGIYVGDGKFIHAPQSGETVRVEKLSNRTNFIAATRPTK